MANTSRTSQYIENKKQTSLKPISAALNKENLVNFCAPIKKVMNVNVDPPKIDCACDFEQL